MTQPVKTLSATLDGLSLIPGTQVAEELVFLLYTYPKYGMCAKFT